MAPRAPFRPCGAPFTRAVIHPPLLYTLSKCTTSVTKIVAPPTSTSTGCGKNGSPRSPTRVSGEKERVRVRQLARMTWRAASRWWSSTPTRMVLFLARKNPPWLCRRVERKPCLTNALVTFPASSSCTMAVISFNKAPLSIFPLPRENAYVAIGLFAAATRRHIVALGQPMLQAAYVGVLRRQVDGAPPAHGAGDGVLGLLQRLGHGIAAAVAVAVARWDCAAEVVDARQAALHLRHSVVLEHVDGLAVRLGVAQRRRLAPVVVLERQQ